MLNFQTKIRKDLMSNLTQKLETIHQEILSLKNKEREIETTLVAEMVTLLKSANAFYLDFDVVLGGLLEVIHKAQNNSLEQENWRQAGETFRKKLKKPSRPRETVQKDAAHASTRK